MYDGCGPYRIGKFIYESCWDICTPVFDLPRYDSITGILPLCKYDIKCSCRHSSLIFLGTSANPTWLRICSFHLIGLLLFFHFQLERDIVLVPHNLSYVFLCHFFFISSAHATRLDLEIDGSTISHISNAWSKDIIPSFIRVWYIWALRVAKNGTRCGRGCLTSSLLDTLGTHVSSYFWIALSLLFNWLP